MKAKITRKMIKSIFKKIFYCGYGDLQYITSRQPQFYNCGVYGWNYDVYSYGDIAVIAGYRGTFGKQINISLIKQLKKEAIENNSKEAIENRLIEYLKNN